MSRPWLLPLLSVPMTWACSDPPPSGPPEPPPLVAVARSQLASIEASSQLTSDGEVFSAAKAFDGDTSTAWCEGVPGLGAGETLMVTMRSSAEIARIEVDAGFYKDDRTLNNNGRPRKITVSSDAGWSSEIRFPHQPTREHTLPKINVSPSRLEAPGAARTLTFRLDEADAGRVTEDVCISRIVLYTR
jgi:hypothetical protein